jgi:hypothetical protein
MLVFDILVSVRAHGDDHQSLDESAIAENRAKFHAHSKQIIQLLDVTGIRYKASAHEGDSMIFEFSDGAMRMHPILQDAKQLNHNIVSNLTTYLTQSMISTGQEKDPGRWFQVFASLRFNAS